MFNNLLRSNKKNSDIENILNDDIYSSNIINKVKPKLNFINEIIKENKPKIPTNLIHNYTVKSRNLHYYNNLKNKSLPKLGLKYKTIKFAQISLRKDQNKNDNKNNNDNNIQNSKQFNLFTSTTNFKTVQDNTKSKNYNSKSTPILKPKTNNISKNKKVSFGKSLNQILLNNIKTAIRNKGNLIQKLKRKKFSSIIYKSGYSNKSEDDLHKKIFDEKLIEIYEDYQKRLGLYRKQRINKLMPAYEKRKFEMRNDIPIYIKGYNKKKMVIFYTRYVSDLNYQRYYNKSQLNIEDILENHNRNNRKEYISGNIPFFLLTKTLYKPIRYKRSISLNNTPIKKD